MAERKEDAEMQEAMLSDSDDLSSLSSLSDVGDEELAGSGGWDAELDRSPLPYLDDEQFLQCQSMVDVYPKDYGCHLRWIDALRGRHGRTADEVREARERMHREMPMAEAEWTAWSNDELLRLHELSEDAMQVSVAMKGEDEEETPASKLAGQHTYLEELVEKAQQDFISISMWMRFLGVAERRFAAGEVSMEYVREKYEKALHVGGRHFTEAPALWKMCRDFEQNMLATLEGLLEAGAGVHEQVEEQRERVRTLYARQVSTPMKDLKLAWVDYRAWEKKAVPPQLNKKYTRTLKFARERLGMEKKIANSVTADGVPDVSKLPAWAEYLRFEEKKKHTTQTLCLYERAVKIFFSSEDLWAMYAAFVDGELGHAGNTDVHERAVRNLAWSGAAWGRLIRAKERAATGEKDMYTLFKDKALVAPIRSLEEYLPIYQAYFDYMRRHLRSMEPKEMSKGKKFLRQKYKEAVKRFAEGGSPLCRQMMMIDHAKIEAEWAPEKVADAWKSVTEVFPGVCQVWLAASRSALRHGKVDVARDLLHAGAEAVKDWPEKIMEEWMEMEREYGTCEDWYKASNRTTILTRILAHKRQVALAKEEAKANGKGGDGRKKGGKKEAGKKDKGKQKSKVLGKRKREEAAEGGDAAALKLRATVQVTNLPVLDAAVLETKLKEVFGGVGPVHDVRVVAHDGKAAEAFVSFKNVASASTACEQSGSLAVDGQHLTVQHATKKPPGPRLWHGDECTAFVKNLPYETDEAALRLLFAACKVKDVRVLMDKRTKKSKGLAYIEMEDAASLEEALKLNNTQYGDRTLHVLKSQPTSGRSKYEAPPKKMHKPNSEASSAPSHPARRFAPRSVRSKSSVAAAPKKAEGDNSKKLEKKGATSGSSSDATAPKSNEDFRRMLFGGK